MHKSVSSRGRKYAGLAGLILKAGITRRLEVAPPKDMRLKMILDKRVEEGRAYRLCHCRSYIRFAAQKYARTVFTDAESLMMIYSTPLENYPVARTRSIEEAREAVAQVYARPILEPTGNTKKLDVVINNCKLKHVSLSFGTYGAAVRVEFPAVDRFVLVTCVRGEGIITSGNTMVPLRASRGALFSPDMGYKANYGDECERILLQIDAQALTAKLAALTGKPINKPLRMDPCADFARPVAQTLHEYLPLLIKTLSTADAPLPNWWIAQTEQFLMTMYLFAHRHNYSELLQQEPPDAAAWQVRRAEEYIEANCRRPVSLEELAEVSGVSAFGLFRAFKRLRGYSPSEFALQLRSRHRGRC